MCVIFVADKETRPTPGMVEAAFETNSAGAGIAWREKNQVRWRKGMDLQQVQDMVRNVPLPFAVHFRIPTCGGHLKRLNHPFPILDDVPLDLVGHTKGYVLFHNGHWGRWKDQMMEAAQRSNKKIPSDKWSDSRAMAWMAAHFGLGVLDLIDEKVCAFGMDEIDIFGTGWVVKDSIWCSNDHWTHKPSYRAWERTSPPDKEADSEKFKQSTQNPKQNLLAGGTDGKSAEESASVFVDLTTLQPRHHVYCRCPQCNTHRSRSNGGGAPESTPFDQAKKLLEEAEELWLKKGISKKMLQRCRREFDLAKNKQRREDLKMSRKQLSISIKEFVKNSTITH